MPVTNAVNNVIDIRALRKNGLAFIRFNQAAKKYEVVDKGNSRGMFPDYLTASYRLEYLLSLKEY